MRVNRVPTLHQSHKAKDLRKGDYVTGAGLVEKVWIGPIVKDADNERKLVHVYYAEGSVTRRALYEPVARVAMYR